MTFTSLARLLPHRISDNPQLKAGLLASQVQRFSERAIVQMLGAKIASQVKGMSFHRGQLQLRVADQMTAQELRLREFALKNKINQELGRPALKQVRCLVAVH